MNLKQNDIDKLIKESGILSEVEEIELIPRKKEIINNYGNDITKILNYTKRLAMRKKTNLICECGTEIKQQYIFSNNNSQEVIHCSNCGYYTKVKK